MRLPLFLALVCALLFVSSAVRAGGNEGPLLSGPFSLSGEPIANIPFTLHWHPGKNIASLFLRYPEHRGSKTYAYFAHVWSLDQDRVLVYYKGFNLSFCHDYAVVGDVPRRFWHSVDNIGSGKCGDGAPVTWYEGKWNPLFVPYGIKNFRLGFDKSEKPVCAEIIPYSMKKKGGADGSDNSTLHSFPQNSQHIFEMLAHHKSDSLRFNIDYDDSPPTMSLLLPNWLQRKCKNTGLNSEEIGAEDQAPDYRDVVPVPLPPNVFDNYRA